MSAIAEFIAGQPGLSQRLLAVHVADEHGRCRGCTRAGTGTPWEPWPCAIHHYASAAQRRAARERPA